MWLPRCIDRHLPRAGVLAALAAMLITAGCASSGAPQPAPERAQRSAPAESTTAPEGAAVTVPPRALTLYEQATAVMAAGDFLEAQLRLEEFALSYPQYPGAYVNLAIIHSANGDESKAREAVDRALAVDPDFAPALNQLGQLLRKNGNFLQAEAAYLKAVTASPDYALAHYNLGVLNELYLQRLDVALQHFELYQGLVKNDKQVEKWIADLRRRVAASQRTANVSE